jgi:hypothetical protein
VKDIEQIPVGEEQEIQIGAPEEDLLPQLASYEDFVPNSEAYRWLLSKLCGESLFSSPTPNMKDIIGSKVLETLRSQDTHRKISRRKRTPATQMTFNMHWDLRVYMEYLGVSPSEGMWNEIVCLTGSRYEVQAATVAEYLGQTWPSSGKYLEKLLFGLLGVPEGQSHTCKCLHHCIS